MPAESPQQYSDKERHCALIILGMHRSGTSALAGVLAALGVDAGLNLQDGNEFNAKGYWEHRAVVQIQDELLNKLGSTWHDIRPLPADWEKGEPANAARCALTALLRHDFAASKLWLVKDPRACRLLPLWRSVLTELGVNARYILTVRHPADVAASLAHRDHMPSSRAHLLWLAHTIEIERQTREEQRVIVTYDDMLNDWPSVIDGIVSSLGIDLNLHDQARQEAVREFLSPHLRHHQVPEHPPGETTALYGLAVSVFNAFRRSHTSNDLTNALKQQGEIMNLLNEIVREAAPSGAAAFASGLINEIPATSPHLVQGMHLLESGQFEEAFASLSQALNETPDSADVLVQLGKLALVSGMHDEAANFFHEAIAHTIDGLQKVHSIGRELLQGGQLDACRIVLTAIDRSMASTPASRSADDVAPQAVAPALPAQSSSHNATFEAPSIDIAKVYATCSKFDDRAWQQVMLASVKNNVLEGIRLPGFASETLQRNTVGSAGQQALHEGQLFYDLIKKYTGQLGAPLRPDSRILDFGCGWGRYLRYFLKDTLASNLYGVDVDPMMTDACTQSFPYGNFTTVQPLPPTGFPDGQFDLIFAYSVFSHLSAPTADAWVEEFSRLLAPGGLLIVTTQGRDFVAYCQQIRDSIALTGTVQHLWHENLAKAFVDSGACLRAYDQGEHLFSPTGGGDARPSTFYGEALVPRGHVERVWGQHLLLRDFVDDKGVLPQALIVMQKPGQSMNAQQLPDHAIH